MPNGRKPEFYVAMPERAERTNKGIDMDELISRLMTHFIMAIANGQTNLADDLAEAINMLKQACSSQAFTK